MHHTNVIGTPCATTTYSELTTFLEQQKDVRRKIPLCIDFTNVHIVTQRKTDPEFRKITDTMDLFVPDSQVLCKACQLFGSKIKERVYGPTFLKFCIENINTAHKHYFLGGSSHTLEKLLQNLKILQPNIPIAGSHHGYFNPDENQSIIDHINKCQPDLIWVGLGTPKQQEWIHQNRKKIKKGTLLAVGFAFDVNAGTKKDSPEWMGKYCLGWLYRLLSEPKRLIGRYAYYNTLFLYYVLRQRLSSKTD